MRIDGQVDLARVSRAAFADGLGLIAGGTATVLVGLHVGAIDEGPLEIGLLDQCLENLEPLAGRRPGIEALVDRVPAPEGAGQVSPGAAGAHPVDACPRPSCADPACGKWLAEAERFPASTRVRQ